jgi:hypothetical protein
MKLRVIEDWQATYADPIRLAAGDMLYLTGREDNWDGHIWLWARSLDGLEGWVPDNVICEAEGRHVAKGDYTAAELTCRRGQVLTAKKETHGWVFCIAEGGAAGWVPRKNLIPNGS